MRRAQGRLIDMRRLLPIFVLVISPGIAFAHGDEEHHQNVKVLVNVPHEDFDAGMKLLTKALGVKCRTCHVKGDNPSDKLATKVAARAYFVDRDLGALLRALELPSARNEALLADVFALWKLPKPGAKPTAQPPPSSPKESPEKPVKPVKPASSEQPAKPASKEPAKPGSASIERPVKPVSRELPAGAFLHAGPRRGCTLTMSA